MWDQTRRVETIFGVTKPKYKYKKAQKYYQHKMRILLLVAFRYLYFLVIHKFLLNISTIEIQPTSENLNFPKKIPKWDFWLYFFTQLLNLFLSFSCLQTSSRAIIIKELYLSCLISAQVPQLFDYARNRQNLLQNKSLL